MGKESCKIEENQKKIMDAFRQIESEKGTVYPLVIGGERITTNQTITSYNPANKEVLGSVCACTAELADQAIHTANKAFAAWSHTTVDERVRTLRKLATFSQVLRLSDAEYMSMRQR